jgi:hypothetical protein
LMDIHHDTSFRSILEDDSISFISKSCIHFCLGKGGKVMVDYWSIYSFVLYFTLYFHFNDAFSS